MAYTALITNIGLAKIADAIANDEAISITTGKVGDGNGNPVSPSETDLNLVRSVFETSLNRIEVDPVDDKKIYAEIIVPANEGGWTIREVGLFDDDGDMIAVAAFPEVYKPTDAEGATMDLIIRLVLFVSNSSAITLVVDSNVVIASRAWVEANYSLTGLLPGGSTGQILRKRSNSDGDTEWANPTDVNVVVNIIQEQQVLSAGQTTVTLATCTTAGAAVYIEGVRLHPVHWTATSSTIITLATSYPHGSRILIVQNDPVGANDYLESAQNLADVPNKATARANLELLTNATYLDALWALMQQRTYPVGEILTTRRPGNPSSWMGFGTWERYGQGRVLVGYDEADSSFNNLDKTGGAKTHVLTTNEMPSHSHFVPAGGGAGGSIERIVWTDSYGFTTNTGANSNAAGGGAAHNNLQPYITVFMWRRTA